MVNGDKFQLTWHNSGARDKYNIKYPCTWEQKYRAQHPDQEDQLQGQSRDAVAQNLGPMFVRCAHVQPAAADGVAVVVVAVVAVVAWSQERASRQEEAHAVGWDTVHGNTDISATQQCNKSAYRIRVVTCFSTLNTTRKGKGQL